MAGNEMDATTIVEVERILGYWFKNKKLLEEALTHSSCAGTISYDRLEFFGDAALGLAFSKYFYLEYPSLDQNLLTSLRAANVSTEKFARTAIRRGLFKYVRHNSPQLEKKVEEFAIAIQDEEEYGGIYGGSIPAPKSLADIVESLASAVYIDCNYDLQALWLIFRGLLKPIITYEVLKQRPHPVTSLFEQCQKIGKQVDVKYDRDGVMYIASVLINGKLIASARSPDKQDTARLYAAREALRKLDQLKNAGSRQDLKGEQKIGEAKQTLLAICEKKKWPKPIYTSYREEVVSPAKDRNFKCSVSITTDTGTHSTFGDTKSRIKHAEHSAASHMLLIVQESLHQKCLFGTPIKYSN